MTCPVCHDEGLTLAPCWLCALQGPPIDLRVLQGRTDDAIRRICLGMEIPPAVIGYGWLVPDQNPMPRLGWRWLLT